MNKNVFFIIALFFLALNCVNAQGTIRSSNYKKSSVVWLDHTAFILEHKKETIKELYRDINRSFYITENGEYDVEEVYTTTVVVPAVPATTATATATATRFAE